MNFDERLITVAIHTCEHAIALKDKLEHAGVSATLQNINLEHPVVASGMRVRIKESDLAKALLIIEGEDTSTYYVDGRSDMAELLVPVDFSLYSLEAAIVAYHLAAIHNAKVTLLNTYYQQVQAVATQLSDALTYDKPLPENSVENIELASQKMSLFRQAIAKRLPKDIAEKVKTTIVFRRGLPEDVINEYSKELSPLLIVMGTRCADKKGRDSIGSVTAEVLDTCRRPVLTVPEGCNAEDIINADQVLYFCNGEQVDILAIQRIHELFKDSFRSMTLGSLQSRRFHPSKQNLEALCTYCAEHYRATTFDTEMVDLSEHNRSLPRSKSEIIAIANRRKSAFSRLFNPGMAHRLLFKADIPILAIPV